MAMLQPRSLLGPYEIESLIGAGGMGEVYKARDTRLNRTVAIKVRHAVVRRRRGAHSYWLAAHAAA